MPFLPWALDDLASSPVALEVLVCDDGSRDGSFEWLTAVKSVLDGCDASEVRMPHVRQML